MTNSVPIIIYEVGVKLEGAFGVFKKLTINLKWYGAFIKICLINQNIKAFIIKLIC